MTKQEHFKQRIRARMAKTGERYGAARRALIEPEESRQATGPREWVSNPEFTDEVIRSNTGRDLFPGFDTEMRSKPSTKSPRVAFPDGLALFTLTPLDDGRLRINVAHGQLESPADVDHWKAYWSEWLVAVDESAPD